MDILDDYKRSVIAHVRERPFLWDLRHVDYKNKDQRKLVWEEIDDLLPPAGPNVNAKSTWDQLRRGFSNALKRRDKRYGNSGNGIVYEMEWKFEKDMMFLLPIKQLRSASGNSSDTGMETITSINYEDSYDSFIDQSHSHNDIDYFRDRDDKEQTAILIQKETQGMNDVPQVLFKQRRDNFQDDVLVQKETDATNDLPQPQLKRKKGNIQENASIVINMMKPTQCDKNESPRLDFFRSLMPSIDSLDEDDFMNLQIEIIQIVKKQKRAPNHVGQ